MFTNFKVSASGMEAQRTRLNTIASNLANVNTTRADNGEPYRKRDVIFEASSQPFSMDNSLVSVKVKGVVKDQKPFRVVYSPGHPDADKDGNLRLPNINPIEEMVNMISAVRAYESNIQAFKSARDMMAKALEIGR